MAGTKTLTQTILDKGYELQEMNKQLLDQRNANRRSLRDLDTQGLLSEDESAALAELYPEREPRSDDERIADAEDKLARARERAAGRAEGDE